MKKSTFLFGVILLLASILGTAMAESEEYTYLAVLSRYTPQEEVYHFTEMVVDLSRYDISLAVHATLCFARPVPLILPDWNGWRDTDYWVGALVTFDKPFDFYLDRKGVKILQIPDGVILEPKRVEVVGEIRYGIVMEFGDDYMVHDAFDDNMKPSGNSTRYTITPETLMLYEESTFVLGSGCQLIVDKDGVVLAMQQANG